MLLSRYLARLGYGSRKEVELLIRQRRITTRDTVVLRDGDCPPHDTLCVDGAPLDPPEGSVLLLNKPLGYVCSTNDRPPIVYELLPARFLARSPVMATVGRLDADTTGLLLLTDDGALNHRITSPRTHLPKTYRATLAESLRGEEAAQFASGTFMLKGEDTPLRPATLVVHDTRTVDVSIMEGRYHQVRRMFAATGNHVVSLQRIALGPLSLDGLAEGTWRLLSASEVASLRFAARRSGGEGPDAG
jgi:16S rRNA pseudouridine516 synthase